MGSEASHLNGLEIDEKAIEITDFWSHHHATVKDRCRYFGLHGIGALSVFKGESIVPGALWSLLSPLEKCSNNLLKYRHPCIVRYISAWQQRSILHLATELVRPLTLVLPAQSPLQICIGLNNVLQALVFLHEQALMAHNNVCVSSIYVTPEGQWKLGGLQYLCSLKEMTSAYLKQARIHRYDKAVDPNEDTLEVVCRVDHYAFAVLVDDVFKGKGDDEVPHLREFKQICQQQLQNRNPTLRPLLSILLQHDFFNHDFITIYKFLTLLPLKTEDERTEFFSDLLTSLSGFDEEVVAKQLGSHLLSRLVLLDATARREVLPYILTPTDEKKQAGTEIEGLFSLGTFKAHLKPKLIQIFCVRDTQIRLLLLEHFQRYVHVFSHDELSQNILPELLLGIKDLDDNLVATTLRCLSELVPILGAATVIGGKRTKVFSDGRPTHSNQRAKRKSINKHTNSIQLSVVATNRPQLSNFKDLISSSDLLDSSTDSLDNNVVYLERPAPLGGESSDIDHKIEERIVDENDWSDWEANDVNNERDITNIDDHTKHTIDFSYKNEISKATILIENTTKTTLNEVMDTKTKSYLQKAALDAKKKKLIDISELDIKMQKADICRKGSGDEFDFFADMTPVIQSANVGVEINSNSKKSSGGDSNSKLNFVPQFGEERKLEEAWGEDWGDEL